MKNTLLKLKKFLKSKTSSIPQLPLKMLNSTCFTIMLIYLNQNWKNSLLCQSTKKHNRLLKTKDQLQTENIFENQMKIQIQMFLRHQPKIPSQTLKECFFKILLKCQSKVLLNNQKDYHQALQIYFSEKHINYQLLLWTNLQTENIFSIIKAELSKLLPTNERKNELLQQKERRIKRSLKLELQSLESKHEILSNQF